MTPTEQGRFCSICSKSVTDFTQMNDEEIIIYLRKNGEHGICGRFRKEQLNEKVAINIPRAVLYSQRKFINIFLLALLVTMGSMLFSCTSRDYVTTGELVVESADTLPPMPNTTVGTVSFPQRPVPFDSVCPPPPVVPVKTAPKAKPEDLRISPQTPE